MSHRLLAATVVALSALTLPVTAQQSQPKQPDATAAAPATDVPRLSTAQPNWVKTCQKDEKAKAELCQTSRDLRSEIGQTMASVSIREQKTDKGVKRGLLMAVPPGMQIPPGVRVLVDQQQAMVGKYTVCFAGSCIVEAELTDASMASLRKGTTLSLQLASPANRNIILPIGLDGFAKVLDGEQFDPKTVQAKERQVGDDLRKRFKCAANPSGPDC